MLHMEKLLILLFPGWLGVPQPILQGLERGQPPGIAISPWLARPPQPAASWGLSAPRAGEDKGAGSQDAISNVGKE